MALSLGARRPAPDDERLARSAASGANAVGAAGVSVAACAAAGAAGTSVLGLSGVPLGSAISSASAVLGTVAASASVVGVVGTPRQGEMLKSVSFWVVFLMMIVGAFGLLDIILMYVFLDGFRAFLYQKMFLTYCFDIFLVNSWVLQTE